MRKKTRTLADYPQEFLAFIDKALTENLTLTFSPVEGVSAFSQAISFRRDISNFLLLLREEPSHPYHEKANVFRTTRVLKAPRQSTRKTESGTVETIYTLSIAPRGTANKGVLAALASAGITDKSITQMTRPVPEGAIAQLAPRTSSLSYLED